MNIANDSYFKFFSQSWFRDHDFIVTPSGVIYRLKVTLLTTGLELYLKSLCKIQWLVDKYLSLFTIWTLFRHQAQWIKKLIPTLSNIVPANRIRIWMSQYLHFWLLQLTIWVVKWLHLWWICWGSWICVVFELPVVPTSLVRFCYGHYVNKLCQVRCGVWYAAELSQRKANF